MTNCERAMSISEVYTRNKADREACKVAIERALDEKDAEWIESTGINNRKRYQAGQKEMRERAAKLFELDYAGQVCDEIRALPIENEEAKLTIEGE